MNDVNAGMVASTYTLGLTRKEMQKMAIDRIAAITQEFTDGFKFLEDYPKSVTFFGSNQTKESDPYYQDARALSGKIVQDLGYSILSGGGPGIMEAANRGAKEAGGDSLGLIIRLPKEQKVNPYITKEIASYYFFVRKVLLSFSAEAYIFYPGGYGTLDEFFEIITLVQTKKIEGVPIICVGSSYWNSLKEFITTQMLERGAIDPQDADLFTITDNHDEIIDIIRNVPVRNGVPFKHDQVVAPAAEKAA